MLTIPIEIVCQFVDYSKFDGKQITTRWISSLMIAVDMGRTPTGTGPCSLEQETFHSLLSTTKLVAGWTSRAIYISCHNLVYYRAMF